MTVYTGRGQATRRFDRDAIRANLATIGARLAARPDLVVVETLTGPDEFGRTSFITHWWTGHRPRAQVFHADLAAHTSTWLADGRLVETRPNKIN